jgi:hypothetical protein
MNVVFVVIKSQNNPHSSIRAWMDLCCQGRLYAQTDQQVVQVVQTAQELEGSKAGHQID